jgi:hypothetical protein
LCSARLRSRCRLPWLPWLPWLRRARVWRLWLRRLRRLRLWNLHDMDALGLDLVLLRNAPPPTPSEQVSLPGVMKF